MRIWWVGLMLLQVVNSDPQTWSLGDGCSSKVPKDPSNFATNLTATFAQLRANLSEPNHFATADTKISPDPVYAMAQCRNYLSPTDCLACFDAAVIAITTKCNCSSLGARVVFDGCFLRYESYNFYQRTSEQWLICDDVSSSAAGFLEEKTRLLSDLEVATPRMKEYFAASQRNTIVYAVAQCTLTVTRLGCQGCLQAAYNSLQNCSDATGGRVTDVACFMRYSNQSFFPDDQTTPIKLPGKGIDEKAVIGGTVGGSLLFVIVATALMWFKFSRQLKNALIANILGATQLQLPNRYSYTDLKEATNNFSEENKIGQGAFGAVYKATLRNDTVVAVKKLDMKHSGAKEDFESEVRLISNVHHRNLVRLLGCCTKGFDLLLVYEFMEKKSLDRFLYGQNRGLLSWKQRVDIIFGTAKGIAFLHEDYHTTIIHRDIKPGNILLNNHFQAKIADFGLARLLPENQTHASTNFAGTLGYTAPEYAIRGHLSEKVDIYSFGIVMLEIISGRRSTDVTPDSTYEYLLKEAWKLYEKDTHQNLVDVALNLNEYQVEEVKKLVEIAMLCVQSAPSSRPTMSRVIFMLSGDGSIGVQRAVRTPSFGYEVGVHVDNGSLLSTQESDATTLLTQRVADPEK
ncbi:cysteine-rich receptor-like protein kinase 3 [Salvia hispanica]|uniref:cysteine-rich receptor-like protein kinase 3 n=1 Tax=Salvia hispanica TaxID=49212 RepID=UPI002009554B|nr:cysteine-rich receptor-like protein kinase 3 [Salvia hispanica]